MKKIDTGFESLYLFERTIHTDFRGIFTEIFNEELFDKFVSRKFVQQNFVKSKKHTIRGMHWQEAPYGQEKFISVLRGSITDVVLDLRQGSQTYGKIFSVTLSEENYKSLLIPDGFAHGYQALKDDTEVSYLVTKKYQPLSEAGLNPMSKAFTIFWKKPYIISDRDSAWDFLS